MKRVIFPVLFSLFFFLPVFALADTIIASEISSDTTWSPAGGVYIVDSGFSVASGTTLTIEPDTIIKVKNLGYNFPNIYGKIVAIGTKEAPIVFTSFYDDNNRWQGLYFRYGSEGIFDYVDISRAGIGGYGSGDYVGIENDGGVLNIKHSNIHDNCIITPNGTGGSMTAGNGIYNKSGTLSVSDSIIDNNMWGIRIDSGTATISNNIIKNNVDNTGYSNGYGIYAFNYEFLTLLNNTFTGNKRTASVGSPKNFTHSGNTSNDQTNKGFEIGGTISKDTTFSSSDLPLIVGGLTIEAGKTLTIEPGTILKMNDYYSSGSIYIQGGNLIARGTPKKKIYITSLKDDSAGGDTNGDGNTTSPMPEDWSSLFFESGSKVDFDNVIVSYGGYRNYSGYLPGVFAAIYQRGAEFSVLNSFLGHNRGTSIFQDAGDTTIGHSELTNQGMSIWSRGGNITISQSNMHDHGVNVAIYNENGPAIDARNNWWGSSSGPNDISTTTPTGTGDKVSGNILYVPFLTGPPGENKTIDPVIIIPGIMGSAYKNGELVIDPILHTYDDLIATLKANGYTEGKDLFTFPYEWRNSNVITSILLRDKINEAKNICNCSKVDLVAHSMGGLVARQLIQSDKYNNDVDQLIFLGTPHKGSQKAYLQWEAGEFPPGIEEFVTKQLFSAEAKRNGFDNLLDYIQNRPISSVQELLPVFDYLIEEELGTLRNYPNNYPRNEFLENLNSDIDALLSSGIKITNIVGNSGDNTIEKIRVVPSSHSGLWAHGEPENFYIDNTDNGLEKGAGDETVTIDGATLDNSVINKPSTSSHQQIPEGEENEIFKILAGKDSTTDIHDFHMPNVKVALFQLLSPIDFVITAPDNKKIGKSFETGQEYNEIPFAFYSGYRTDNEYITILNPLDGEYKIEVQGMGDGGEYGVLASYISDEFVKTTEVEGITKSGQITGLEVKIDSENPENLESEKVVTPEVLLSDIDGAYGLGWIKNKKTRDTLVRQVEAAIKFSKKIEKVKERMPDGSIKEKKIEKFSIKVNKILTQLFIIELKVLLRKKTITQKAFDLIKSDVDYLINNN